MKRFTSSRAKVAAAAAAVLLVALPAWAADIEVSNPFLRASPMAGGNAAGFLIITNNGSQPDRLLGAQAPVAKVIELHTHIKDGDVYRMRQVDAIVVPAHGSVDLKPGGDHLMFIGVAEQLKEGTKVPVTLTFEKAGAVAVDLPVVAPGAMAPMGGMMHGNH
jgi:copper(I)-binding protein